MKKLFLFYILFIGVQNSFAQCSITVTTSSDSGPGSLRQAITTANSCTGAPTIIFSIPSSSTITLLSDLPSLTHANTLIDGTTAPGYLYPSSMVTLVWASIDDCFQINSGNDIIIKGLAFTDNFLGNGDGTFRVNGGARLLIKNCRAYKQRKNFVRVQGGTDVKVENCTIENFWYNSGNSEKGFEVNSGSLIRVSNCNITNISKKVFEMNNSANGGTLSKVSIYNNTLTNVGYGDSSMCSPLPCGMSKGEHVISTYTSHTATFSIRNNQLNGSFSKFAELINTKSLNGAGAKDSIYNNTIINCSGAHTLYIEMNNNSPAAPAGQAYGGIIILNNNLTGNGPNTYNVDQVIEIGGWANNYTSAKIEGNVITNYHGRGIMFRETDNTSILNNTIYNCSKDQAIELNNDCDNIIIQGNILGTDAANTPGLNLFTGHTIQFNHCDNCTIGGNKSLGQGNIIIAANNNQKGIEVSGNCTGTTTIQGNNINVNSTGNTALSSSGESAIQIMGTTAVIGGDSLTFRNTIAGGAGGKGIEINTTGGTIQGNLIGCQANGSSISLSNLQTGIQLNAGNTTVGSTSVGNLINKIGYGQRAIENNDQDNNLWSSNEYWGNTGNAIVSNQGGSPNNSIAAPSISAVTLPNNVSGNAQAGARVEIYFSNNLFPCQGYKYIGFTTANGAGTWNFTSPISINNSIGALQINGTNASEFICQNVTICNINVSGGNDQSICAGNTAILNGSGAATYVWSNNVQNGAVFTPTSTQTYTVTGTDANGCYGTDQVTITVLQNSTVSAGQDQSICAGASLTLTASGANTYVWSNNVQNGAAFTPTSTQTYTVTGTNANGCSGTDQVTITVLQNPTVSAGQDQTICAGASLTLTASGANTYVWNNNVQNGLAFIPTSTQTYTVSGTSANGCSASDQVIVTVVALPTVSLGADTIVCEYNFPIIIQANGSPNSTYIWNNGVSGNSISVDSAGIYEVTITDANNCSATDDILIESSPCASISEKEINFIFYPNPTAYEITIQCEANLVGREYSITDQLGREITHGKITELKSQVRIDYFSDGLYYISIGDVKKEALVIIHDK
jgi:hypothetical protein